MKKHALVEFKTQEEADFAIEVFHGTEFLGRKLKVNKFQPNQKLKVSEPCQMKKKKCAYGSGCTKLGSAAHLEKYEHA